MGNDSVTYHYLDFDKTGNILAFCGQTLTVNNKYPSKKSAFITLYTKGLKLIVWQTLEIGSNGAELYNCLFSDAGTLFTSV